MATFEGQEVLTRAAHDGVMADADWAHIFPSVMQRLDQNIYHTFPIPASSPLAQLHKAAEDEAADEHTVTIPPALQKSYDYIRECLALHFTTQPPHTIQRLAELILRPTEHHTFLHAYLNALDRVVSVYSGLNALPRQTAEPAVAAARANGVHGTSASAALGSDESLGGALLTPIPWLRDSGVDFGAVALAGSSSPVAAAHGADFDMAGDASDSASSAAPTPDSTSTESTPHALDARPDGAVTQGELLRAEQRARSPPAPVASLAAVRHVSPEAHATTASASAAAAAASASHAAPQDETPHARGPEAIGPEDTGPQAVRDASAGPAVLDMQAAAGRGGGRAHHFTPDTDAEAGLPMDGRGHGDREAAQGEDERDGEGEMEMEMPVPRDPDGDVELVDADGVPEGEGRARDSAPAAVEATGQ